MGIHTHIPRHIHTPIYLSVSSVLIITSYPLVFPYTQPPASLQCGGKEMRDPSKCSLRLRLCVLHVLSLLPFVIPLLLSQPPPPIRILSLSFLRLPFFQPVRASRRRARRGRKRRRRGRRRRRRRNERVEER